MAYMNTQNCSAIIQSIGFDDNIGVQRQCIDSLMDIFRPHSKYVQCYLSYLIG